MINGELKSALNGLAETLNALRFGAEAALTDKRVAEVHQALAKLTHEVQCVSMR